MTESTKIVHDYHVEYERETPIEEIPLEFQLKAMLPGTTRTQTIDRRLCYNWMPGVDGGRFVECSSVATHAD